MFELICENDRRLHCNLDVVIDGISFSRLWHGEMSYPIPIFRIKSINSMGIDNENLMRLELSMLIGRDKDGWDFFLTESSERVRGSMDAIYEIDVDRRGE